MPEWPEMEHYRRELDRLVGGKPITAVSIGREKSLNVSSPSLELRVRGQTVKQVDRRGKQLLFRLGSGEVLLAHLMLGGWMFFGSMADKPERTVQVQLSFGEEHLFFIGLRLGYLHLYTPEELQEKLDGLGPDPFDTVLDSGGLRSRFGARRGALKQGLTDQQVIAGIGNCYGDELCHAAGIRPDRAIPALNDPEWSRLLACMRSVLLEALGHGGYMEDPLYKGDPLTGGYNSRCLVYDRGNEACYRCGQSIVQTELAGRKLFYCPGCQH
ncbi:Fpg/Nei family DNA glycosylase [Paenibacillus sp. y28]|uniref:Fpg/Nei family DNA glycosylase n=1 Tax=Paenibacillus sp. y28 TaxID=3129110 RepID=UPI00301818CF